MRRGDLLRRAVARIGGALTRLAADGRSSPPPSSAPAVSPSDWRGEPRPDDLTLSYTVHDAPPVRWSKEEELRQSWERPDGSTPPLSSDAMAQQLLARINDDYEAQALASGDAAVEGVEAGTIPVIPAKVISESQGADDLAPPTDPAVAWWRATFLCEPPSAEVARIVLETTRGGPQHHEVKVEATPGVRTASSRNEAPPSLPEAIRTKLDEQPRRPLALLNEDVTEANVDVQNTIAASRATLRQLLTDTTQAGVRAISVRLAPLLHPVLGSYVVHLDPELFLPWFQSERERCRLIPFFSTAALSFKNRPARLSVSHDVKERLAALGWFPYLMDARNQTIWVGFVPVAANAASLGEALSHLPDDVPRIATKNWVLYQRPVAFICLHGSEPIEFNQPDAD